MGIVSKQFDKREKLDKKKLNHAYEMLHNSVSYTNVGKLLDIEDVEAVDQAAAICIRYCGAVPGVIPEGEDNPVERIEYMCRTDRIMHRAIRLESGWYKDSFGAIMGELKSGEVVALIPDRYNRYYYRDPSTGKKIKINKKTEGNLKEKAEVFYPSFPSKKLEYEDLFKFIIKRLDAGDFLLILFASIASILVGFLPAYVTSIAYGTVAPSGMASLILPIVFLLLGVAASTILMGMFRNLVINRITIKISVYIESATFSRILTLPTSFFRKNSPGSLAYIQSQLVRSIEALTTIILGGGLSFALSIVYVIQINYYAKSLTPIVLVVLLIQVSVIIVYVRLALRFEEKAQKASSSVSGIANSLLRGVSKIKLAGAQDRTFSVWAKKYAVYADALYHRPMLLYCIESIVTVIGMFGIISIYLTSIQSRISAADYMAFNTAYGQITAAMVSVLGLINSLVTAISSTRLIKPVLETEPEKVDDRPVAMDITGRVEVKGVSFRYAEDLPWVLKDLNLTVEPGEYVGIVGSSGCGKSTLIRILLGFETPEVGRVTYDSYDTSEVDVSSLRNKTMSVVMQDSKLLKADIYHNIILSSPEATIDDAWRAAEIAGIADDIRKMPMGMNTLVSEGGGGLSGGQRQRLIIARAVCSKRKVMILDEATSALDNITQQHVADSLAKLDYTRIVVAHRLSTVKHCDRIIVLDKGTVAESGTYEELIDKNGLFAKLVERQRVKGE